MRSRLETAGISLAHGGRNLPKVSVDTYGTELREGGGFLGDRASRRAFTELLEASRKRLRQLGSDPLGDTPSDHISKKKLDKILAEGDPDAAGLVQGAVEAFAQALADVLRRFLVLKSWRRTERVVVGGGLRGSRIGELAIGRCSVLLKESGIDVELVPIRYDPDSAGLIGAVQLAPSWIFSGHEAVLAVDIGGTNFRVGIVATGGRKHPDPSRAAIVHSTKWSHADDDPGREEAVERLIEMVIGLIKHARKEKVTLAPFIGVGCPGLIREDGLIERGSQNLPGKWVAPRFCLPARLKEGVGRIGEQEPIVLMHNDAVVQGLSEVPWMGDVERWGVLTLGTGLGNARFTNKADKE